MIVARPSRISKATTPRPPNPPAQPKPHTEPAPARGNCNAPGPTVAIFGPRSQSAQSAQKRAPKLLKSGSGKLTKPDHKKSEKRNRKNCPASQKKIWFCSRSFGRNLSPKRRPARSPNCMKSVLSFARKKTEKFWFWYSGIWLLRIAREKTSARHLLSPVF